MRQHQHPRPSLSRHPRQLLRRSVIPSMILLPLHRPPRKPGGRINLMHQHIAPMASLRDHIGRPRIPRNHDAPAIRGIEPVPKRLRPLPMRHPKRSHRNIRIPINHPTLDLMRMNFVARLIRRLASINPNPDILPISLGYMPRHPPNPPRTIKFKRHSPLQSPRSKNQIRQPDRMVRVQMSSKRNLQIRRFNPRRNRSPNHPRPKIDQVRSPASHHRHRRPRPIRLSIRRPRPQQNNLRRNQQHSAYQCNALPIFQEGSSPGSPTQTTTCCSFLCGAGGSACVFSLRKASAPDQPRVQSRMCFAPPLRLVRRHSNKVCFFHRRIMFCFYQRSSAFIRGQ